jgi:hypothetical protein
MDQTPVNPDDTRKEKPGNARKATFGKSKFPVIGAAGRISSKETEWSCSEDLEPREIARCFQVLTCHQGILLFLSSPAL